MNDPLNAAREALAAWDAPPVPWRHYLVRCEHGHDISGHDEPPTPEHMARECRECDTSDPSNNHVREFSGTRGRPTIEADHLRAALSALDAVTAERDHWQDVAHGRKVDLANADTTLTTVRFALGDNPAGNGWTPPRGVDPVVDLALDVREERDRLRVESAALAAIRTYFTVTSDLAREEFAAEWEAIPEEDRARFQAWGDRACQAGIDCGDEAVAEVEAERDRLAAEVAEARAVRAYLDAAAAGDDDLRDERWDDLAEADQARLNAFSAWSAGDEEARTEFVAQLRATLTPGGTRGQ